jgi:hypothetical protein
MQTHRLSAWTVRRLSSCTRRRRISSTILTRPAIFAVRSPTYTIYIHGENERVYLLRFIFSVYSSAFFPRRPIFVHLVNNFFTRELLMLHSFLTIPSASELYICVLEYRFVEQVSDGRYVCKTRHLKAQRLLRLFSSSILQGVWTQIFYISTHTHVVLFIFCLSSGR